MRVHTRRSAQLLDYNEIHKHFPKHQKKVMINFLSFSGILIRHIFLKLDETITENMYCQELNTMPQKLKFGKQKTSVFLYHTARPYITHRKFHKFGI